MNFVTSQDTKESLRVMFRQLDSPDLVIVEADEDIEKKKRRKWRQ